MSIKVKLFTATVAAAAATFAIVSNSQASTAGVDLSMTGSVVAGVRSASTGQEIPFSFTMTNYSTTTTANIAFTFTIVHGSVDAGDYVCPLTTSHYDINPDTPSCESGDLAHGASSGAAILVTPTIISGTMTVRACASNLNGTTDPVSSNNCKTLTIRVV